MTALKSTEEAAKEEEPPVEENCKCSPSENQVDGLPLASRNNPPNC
jgi:hypothetical protein